jgi:uncharacterized protein
MKPVDSLLPSSLAAKDVTYRLGLVSDTHIPSRLAQLPSPLIDALQGVDMILHAGDVGELWVLDQLSTVAPVVAVHGNDEGTDTALVLPYRQLIVVQNKRILLWHSHLPNWDEELAARKDDELEPKLREIAVQGQKFDAEIVVFGHWHFPLVYQIGVTTLINPGALASPNEITRQLHQTAAVLFLDRTGNFHLVHFNLAEPQRAFHPQFDIQAGFAATDRRFVATILDQDLQQAVFALRTALSREEVLMVREVISPLAHRVWRGETSAIARNDFTAAIAATEHLSAELKARILRMFHGI